MSRETGKQRASRIPLDYYRHPNRMDQGKRWLALLALVVTAGIVGAAIVLRDGGKRYVSRGPVIGKHAAWDNQCEACHADFTPIAKGNVATSFVGGLLPGSHEFPANQRCEQCHAGTDHSANQKVEMTPSCAGCHRDHRGRDASLVRLADSDCTQCHGNLADSLASGKSDYSNSILGFSESQGHPNFRSLKEDPGKLKFNHRLHMLPGQGETGQAKPWTLSQIADTALRTQYTSAPWQADKQPTAAVQLDCSSCHAVDGAGAYMLPVNYAAHCSACHPLTFDASVKATDGKLVAAPHGVQPAQVKNFLWGAYAAKYGSTDLGKRLQGTPKDTAAPSRPLPGKAPSVAELSDADKKLRGEIASASDAAAQFLFKADVARADSYLLSGKSACGECHVYEGKAGAERIEPVQVRKVWLEHARFEHASHRAVECRSCHANAYPDGPQPSVSSKDVLIAGVENCRECHAPVGTKDGKLVGGVRSDCTECHLYHHGDRWMQTAGTLNKFKSNELFLKGSAD